MKIHERQRPKAGSKLDFPGGEAARVESIGSQIMFCKMVGKKKLKQTAVGSILDIGADRWKVIAAGKKFKLGLLEKA